MQVHVLSETMVRLGMILLKQLPINLVDNLVLMLAEEKHGNLSSYGIHRPKEGPFFLKKETGRSAVIDVGTIAKIRAGEIQVYYLVYYTHAKASPPPSISHKHTQCVACRKSTQKMMQF